ncbi:MAG: SynChlorMet cassette radical SAM/SPASM protein ScmF [Polyangiaceae bacterium]|nr:SynChlorMet cassette radical SAM/SPASM protein ScmF [Polyangiaceae bacterium]
MASERVVLPPGVPPLRTLYVYLTGGCNLACRHCWLTPSFHPDGGTGGHLPYELFERAIDEAIPLGLQGVKLTGGEPFLHPEILRLVGLLKARRIGLTIETNGTLVTEELALALKERSTLNHISVSIDGSHAELHDPFRGVAGSFDRAVSGVKALVAAGYRPQIIMSLHVGNVDDVEPLVRMAEGLGAGSVKFNPVQPCGRGEQLGGVQHALTVGQLVDLGYWIDKELQMRSSVGVYFSWPIAFHSLKRLNAGNFGTCGIHSILGVLPAGELAMCGIGTLVTDLCYGQLGVDQLREVWLSHPILTGLRRSIPSQLEGICSRCLLREACLGYCVAENYHHSESLTAPFWFCQQAEILGLFPGTRLVASMPSDGSQLPAADSSGRVLSRNENVDRHTGGAMTRRGRT